MNIPKFIPLFLLYSIVLLSSACHHLHQPHLHERESLHFPDNMPLNQKIAHVAEYEHRLWHRPFINQNGHILKRGVGEATRAKLSNGQTAWQRVAQYWATPNMQTFDGLSSCFQKKERHIDRCRALLLDKPWSAAFVSYVMTQAGASDFVASPAHIAYIRAAAEQQGGYQLAPAVQTVPQVGDLLCYSRSSNVKNHVELKDFLQNNTDFLPTHCDVVVKVNAHDVHLIGGNVFDAVMLRKLPLNENQHIVFPDETSEQCDTDNEIACNVNRQYWVAMLKRITHSNK